MMLSIRKYGVACGVAVGELGVMVLDSVGGRVFIVGVGENVSAVSDTCPGSTHADIDNINILKSVNRHGWDVTSDTSSCYHLL
jgi:hypothetical protein